MALRSIRFARTLCPPRTFHGYRAASVTAAQVKELREKSGAPMMECKKALQDSEVNGDISKAMDWLRAKGIAKATSGSTRVAAEGLVAIFENSGKLTLVEVNSETDFVSRNSSFQKFVSLVASTANSLDCGELSVDQVMNLSTGPAGSLQDVLGDITTSIRENIVVRRVTNVDATGGNCVAGYYMHGKIAYEGSEPIPDGVVMGREASLVTLVHDPTEGVEGEVLVNAARRLAMHVVAAKPTYLNVEEVPEAVVSAERAIYREQTLENPPKKAEMIDKIVEGKLNKRLSELTLTGQNHMAVEGSPVVAKYLTSLKGEAKVSDITISGFWRWSLGQLAAKE